MNNEELRLRVKERLKNLESGFSNVFTTTRKPILGGNYERKTKDKSK